MMKNLNLKVNLFIKNNLKNFLDLNMPKQIQNKIFTNNQIKSNSNFIDTRENYSKEKNHDYMSEPINIVRSNSKKNLIKDQNYFFSNNINQNNDVFIPESLKIKKLETITTSSYVSTPVFNKEKENEKISDKEKQRLIFFNIRAVEDRFIPYEEKKRKKLNLLNSQTETLHGNNFF